MIRIQPSWLLEAVGGKHSVDSIYFPYLPRFSSVNWFLRSGINLLINTPVDSQAMLFRAWLKDSVAFTEKNTRKFNQVIKNPLDLEMNPFKTFKDRYFSRQQIDYLFYWREAAFEIDDESQREIFWGVVYQIISCWLANRAAKIDNSSPPDHMIKTILDCHKTFVTGRSGHATISLKTYELIDSMKSSLMVYPVVFSEEDSSETEVQQIFHAWFHGHADLEKARKDLRIDQRRFLYKIAGENDFEMVKRACSQSEICAFIWSGSDLPPKLYEQQVAEIFRESFAQIYQKSRLLLKAVDRTSDCYDYLLLLHR